MQEEYNDYYEEETYPCDFDDKDEAVQEISLRKNRAAARKRHHHAMREKKCSKINAAILEAKFNKLPAKVPYSEMIRASRRAGNASKKANRIG